MLKDGIATDFVKLLKVSDILKLQELKFYYKYKNNKLPHYLQTLPFHPNTKTHDHDTRIKHSKHHLRGKHVFAKYWAHFDIPNNFSAKIGILRSLRNIVPNETLIQIYNAIVQLHLDYGMLFMTLLPKQAKTDSRSSKPEL